MTRTGNCRPRHGGSGDAAVGICAELLVAPRNALNGQRSQDSRGCEGSGLRTRHAQRTMPAVVRRMSCAFHCKENQDVQLVWRRLRPTSTTLAAFRRQLLMGELFVALLTQLIAAQSSYGAEDERSDKRPGRTADGGASLGSKPA